MKRGLILLFVTMFAGQVWAYESFTDHGWEYDIIDEENHYVRLIRAYNTDVKATIGQAVNNETSTLYTVTEIGDDAFGGCDRFVKITIYNTVTSIGHNAFNNCSALASVTIGNGVTTIGDCAFQNCSSLKSITIPNAVTSIGHNAFNNCSALASVTIGNSVTTIGDCAFQNCSVLKSISIPDSVTSIGQNAFKNCIGLTSVTIPNSVIDIGQNAFYGCSSLKYKEDDNAYYLGNDKNQYYALIKTKSTNLRSITINNNCVVIADAFRNCVNLKRVTIPNSVTSISQAAFYGCTGLTSITFGSGLTNIGNSAFNNCSGLKSIAIPNAVTRIGVSAFDNCNNVVFYCEASSKPTGWDNCWTNRSPDYIKWNCKAIKVVVNNSSGPLGRMVTAEDYGVVTSGNTYWYECNEQVTLRATLSNGYHVKWNDNSIETVRIFNATESQTFTATFDVYTEVVDTAIAATCTMSGLTEGKHCGNCGAVVLEQKVIPAYGHTEVVDSAIVSTCTESGLTEGKHCAVCGETIVAQEVIPANGHTEVTDAAVAATCTESGLTEGKHCSVCGETIVAQEVIPANGHTEVVDAAVAATCTATGLTKGKHCSVCGVVLVAQTKTPKVAHTIVTDAAVAATSTETGLTEGSHCSVCGAVIVAQEVVPTLGNPGTAISESAITNLQVYAHHNTIIVENATEEIRVYNAMGALVGRDVACRVRAELQVNSAGVYIVKVGTVAKRVMIND